MTVVVLPLSVRDLTDDDLQSIWWSGPLHLTHVAKELRRADVDYLAACGPAGLPLGKCGIDYAKHPGAGTLFQFDVAPALQSCGIGTALARAAEQRILARGLHRAELLVEESNPRGRRLYERLGYAAVGRTPEAWDEQAPDGAITRYETMCTVMRKKLPGTGQSSSYASG